jgi:hypothetical protein
MEESNLQSESIENLFELRQAIEEISIPKIAGGDI